MTVETRSRDEYPVFSFRHVSENHCLLSEWKKDELSELLGAFRTMESLTWNQILGHSGLRFKKIDVTSCSKPLPSNVSDDIPLCEIRVCQKKRIFGYRVNNVFTVIWFDRSHEICPEGKVKKA